MGKDKAELSYQTDGKPQWLVTANLISRFVQKTYVSIRPGQPIREAHALAPEQFLPDAADSHGPLSGIITAMRKAPQAAWLVVACDLPLLSANVVDYLIQQRDNDALSLAYESDFDGLPEPLCTLYEPAMKPVFERYVAEDNRCPRKILIKEAKNVKLLPLPEPKALENANTPEDYERLRSLLLKNVSK